MRPYGESREVVLPCMSTYVWTSMPVSRRVYLCVKTLTRQGGASLLHAAPAGRF